MTGAHWAITASIATAATHATMRSVDLHPFLVTFWRNLFCLFLILPIALPSGAWRCRPGALPRHILRGVINTSAMLLLVMGLVRMPFAEATALTFAAPAFVIVGGILILREQPGRGHILGAALGLVGALVIAPPGYDWFSDGGAFVLISAALFAASLLVSRDQTKFAGNQSILFFLYMTLTAFSFPLAVSVWDWPGSIDFLVLALVACFSILAHWAATIAVRVAEASSIAIFDYLRLVWGALIGILIFGESLEVQTIIGIFLIAAAASAPFVQRWCRSSD